MANKQHFYRHAGMGLPLRLVAEYNSSQCFLALNEPVYARLAAIHCSFQGINLVAPAGMFQPPDQFVSHGMSFEEIYQFGF